MKEYINVGDIVHKALKYAMDIVHPDMPVLELCEKVEQYIRDAGATPAFPVNVGIGSVAAHYTATRADPNLIPKGSVVKIDIGAHIDGYIVDAAVTVSLGTNAYDGLIRASYNALKRAFEALRPGLRAWQIGDVIESVIKSFGYKPIYNLTGHRIERYNLHAGDVVPNYGDKSAAQTMRPGDVYAIEPFATNGKGLVIDGKQITIYKLNRMKSKKHQNYIDKIYSNVNMLPFTPRWFPDIPESFYRDALSDGSIYGYEVLIEGGGGLVSQFEDTFLITEDGAIPLARTLDLL
ncbi:type II methionyl aminopeptidase [Thermoproteus tenax]|uniref:Methionine aminopeptidase n=1 Tax=Thermoproteus tenax (strain ATCC 35583 / DSM 2078 / JCM 9277 / NBRC 100435 / Kra 1) TaxID=768679 RepID=G4RLT6_THETK|nr:type II methionyl aminopeptidase [Thermoproteus tenax]CCC82531.1 Methionine aminopeptidase [Thermoproteus tenax Kra 1]